MYKCSPEKTVATDKSVLKVATISCIMIVIIINFILYIQIRSKKQVYSGPTLNTDTHKSDTQLNKEY